MLSKLRKVLADRSKAYGAIGVVFGLVMTSSIGIAGSILWLPVAAGGLILSAIGAILFGVLGWLIGENRRLKGKK
jgi:hypothetical protein